MTRDPDDEDRWLTQMLHARIPGLTSSATTDFEKTNAVRDWAYGVIDRGRRTTAPDRMQRVDVYADSAAALLRRVLDRKAACGAGQTDGSPPATA